MTVNGLQKQTLPNDAKKIGWMFLGTLAIWILLVNEPLWAAMQIWAGNEIYNHCLIVIPASIYLVYERRHDIDWSSMSFSRIAIALFVLQLVFYILSTAASIQLFRHIAIFSMLPTLVWIFVGDKIAWDIRFALFFVLFSVPVGEELIPFLQELTADLSVFLLDLSGIPLFRSGLYIEIPQGKFLVAEACSGVSFLIASIVLGNLYANMYLVTWRTRILFVFLSVIFPIAANAVRVYGIIYIGYASDMEHAVGADHLIYGWFFFAFVLICMFFIGETIRKREVKWLSAKSNQLDMQKNAPVSSEIKQVSQSNLVLNKTAVISVSVIAACIVGSILQINRMTIDQDAVLSKVNIDTHSLSLVTYEPRVKWEPRYIGNNQEELISLSDEGFVFDLYYAFFNGTKGELVSSLHRLYNQDRWTLVDRKRLNIGEHQVIYELVTTSVGIKKEIIYWYIVDGKIVDTYKEAKFIEFINKLKGKPTNAAIIAVGVNMDADIPSKVDTLMKKATLIKEDNLDLFSID